MKCVCGVAIAVQLAVCLALAAPDARAAAAPAPTVTGGPAAGPTGRAAGLPPPAAPARAAPAAVRPRVRRVPPNEMIAVLGQPVTGPDGKLIGRLTDVLVNAAGVPEAAVIDFGGFMGVGSRNVAVHWSTLRFHPGAAQDRISITLLPAEIGAAPQYKGTRRPAPVVVEPPRAPGSAPGSAPASGASARTTPAPATPHPAVAAATAAAPTVPPVASPAAPFDSPAAPLSTNPLAAPPVVAPSGETTVPR